MWMVCSMEDHSCQVLSVEEFEWKVRRCKKYSVESFWWIVKNVNEPLWSVVFEY